jgi:hypothetical protein
MAEVLCIYRRVKILKQRRAHAGLEPDGEAIGVGEHLERALHVARGIDVANPGVRMGQATITNSSPERAEIIAETAAPMVSPR